MQITVTEEGTLRYVRKNTTRVQKAPDLDNPKFLAAEKKRIRRRERNKKLRTREAWGYVRARPTRTVLVQKRNGYVY